jgi:DNA-binding HxlR family transcriptional regulator
MEQDTLEINIWDANCPSRALLNLIADKWSALVIVKLSIGAIRYGRLHREIGGISHKMLSQTLHNLERRSLVKRVVCETVPPQVEYSLTELGRSLLIPLAGLVEWAETHVEVLR